MYVHTSVSARVVVVNILRLILYVCTYMFVAHFTCPALFVFCSSSKVMSNICHTIVKKKIYLHFVLDKQNCNIFGGRNDLIELSNQSQHDVSKPPSGVITRATRRGRSVFYGGVMSVSRDRRHSALWTMMRYIFSEKWTFVDVWTKNLRTCSSSSSPCFAPSSSL
jgi:hypothetical protein